MTENKSIIFALCQSKTEFKPVVKDKINPFFRSKYADLENYLDATQEALCKYGLFISQTVIAGQLVTTIHHAFTDQTITSLIDIKDYKTPQELGSQLTYLRRYSYASILGLASEDDDANESSAPKLTAKQEQKKVEIVDNSVLPRIEKKFKTLPENEKLTFLSSAQKKLETENQDASDYQKAFDWIVKEKNKLIEGTK